MTARWISVCITLTVLLSCGVVPLEAATIYVGDGDNLQDALNLAQPGDTILLAEGAEFVGNFVLPATTGDGWIIVRTSTPDTVLPAAGVRMQPAYAPLLARLRSPTIDTPALRTAAGAHHWDIRFLEFAANPLGQGDIIQLGDGSSAQNTLEMVPHHIVLDHVYVHGDPALGQKRCIALNAAHVVITDSYVSECKSATQDSQAIGGWNGPGPFTIENNYLEASGENVMFGGADPAIPNLVPSDIIFRRNQVSRPMAWRNPIIGTPQAVSATSEPGGSLPAGVYAYKVVARRLVAKDTMGRSTASVEVTATAASDAGNAVRVRWNAVPDATEYRVYGRTAGTQTIYWRVTDTEFVDTGAAGTAEAVPTSTGTVWIVKNLFELKNARNVFVESNIFENHWKESQPGYSIVLTPRNSNGACTWCVVEHVCFDYNVVRNVAAGFNMIGYDSPPRVTRQTNDIKVFHNLFSMTTALGGNAWLMQMGEEPRDVKIHHNTIDANGTTVVYVYSGTSTDPREVLGFEFVANAARHGLYGINGAFFSYGLPIINAFFPGSRFETNYLAGAPASRYPPGTITVVPFENQFVDVPNGNYTVRDGSPLKGVAPVDQGICAGCSDIVADHPDVGMDYVTLSARTNDVPNRPPTDLPVAPTAAFTVTCTYLECAFADQSVPGTAALADRSWSFGDGSESKDASGVHTFAAPGTYAVRLIVSDVDGLSDSQRITVTVRAPNVPPTAAFGSVCVDLTCTFTDGSTDSDGSIAGWAWTFGDAGTSTLPSPAFKFPAPGTYQTSLTVTDNEGATSMATAAVDVKSLIHAAFMDSTIAGGASSHGTSHWSVTASVDVHGADERPIAGATINAMWSGALTKTLSCITDGNGRCTFTTGTLSAKRTSITLTLTSVSAPLSIYQPSANHDQTGAPTGTSNTYIKP
jgi:PKD repeat protein